MNVIIFFYIFLLFVFLTPGILLTLPPKGSKWPVAIVHGFIFALVWTFTNTYIWETSMTILHPTPTVAVKI